MADRPFAGLGIAAAVAATGLALFGAWTFLSGLWSDAEGRALFEFVRVLLYLLVMVFVASMPRTGEGVRWLVRGLAAGMFVVAASALITRTLPDVWAAPPNISDDRLSYPLTYWNALGAIAGMGVVLAFALSSDLRERAAVRIGAAAALPVFGATLYFTFSRASIALAILGILVFSAVARAPGAASAALTLPATAVAVAAAYSADLLSSENPTSPAATSQGHEVAIIVVLCVLAAAATRWVLTLRFDTRLQRSRFPRAANTRRVVALGATGAVIVAAIALAAGGAVALERQVDRFVQSGALESGELGDVRDRLFDPGNNGRITQWRIAWDNFTDHPLRGEGAGTYRLMWDRGRDSPHEAVEDAHSLYIEALAELGVVGLALLVFVVVAVLVALARLVSSSPGSPPGAARAPAAALLTIGGFWAIHAGIDWDWEMPAVTLGFFAAGGAALAAARGRGLDVRIALPGRLAVAAAILVLLVTPAFVTASERAARDAKQAFAVRDCRTASARSSDAIAALDVRPEPFEIRAYCALRDGRVRDAIADMRAAVARDPHNWRPRYGLSVALAAAGVDPRPEIRRARELNPLDPLALEMSESLWETTDPRSWRRRAAEARIPKD